MPDTPKRVTGIITESLDFIPFNLKRKGIIYEID